jgi:hypothetical protein
VHSSYGPDRLLLDTQRCGSKRGLRLRRAYIIINAIAAKTMPMAISVNSVPETIALSMDMPRVNNRGRVGRGWWT